jgi:hypothetical protein
MLSVSSVCIPSACWPQLLCGCVKKKNLNIPVRNQTPSPDFSAHSFLPYRVNTKLVFF